MSKHGFFSPIAEYDGFDYAGGTVVLASSFAAVAPVRVAWRMVPWREGGSHGLFNLAVRPVFRRLHDSNGHAGLGYGLD